MKTTAQEKVQRQQPAASGKRRVWLERFPLVVAAALLVCMFATGSTQATAGEASMSPAGLWTTLGTRAQAAITSGTRFASDLRLLYQIAELRDASIPAAQTLPAPQAEGETCKAGILSPIDGT